MDKQQKQIEEMEKDLYNIQTYSYMEIYPCRQLQSNKIVAEHLVRKGWIKPDENTVVLTRERYEELEKAADSVQVAVSSFTRLETLYKIKCKELELAEEKTRKETAEKYRELTERAINNVPHVPELFKQAWREKNDEICKEFTTHN